MAWLPMMVVDIMDLHFAQPVRVLSTLRLALQLGITHAVDWRVSGASITGISGLATAALPTSTWK